MDCVAIGSATLMKISAHLSFIKMKQNVCIWLH